MVATRSLSERGKNNIMVTIFPSERGKKRFGGHQIVFCSLAKDNLMATKSSSDKKKKDLVAKRSSFRVY